MASEMLKVCDHKVEDLKKRVIVQILDSEADGFVCSFFVIPKNWEGSGLL